ncbi:leucine-rich repeat-containing protein 63 [Otolemur garnettii]|uniref:leucine-rich repeat-containing protein 63 n=1 Tax=Otolemur garnettii TaxID=30611 RepID=UPI000C7F4BA6|nr:leucine-rich repeat-containing protein 63 [Otolemur garnettii]
METPKLVGVRSSLIVLKGSVGVQRFQASLQILREEKHQRPVERAAREQTLSACNCQKQHLFVEMKKHPQLLRRPLPPKFLKLSFCKKKTPTAKTGETKSPHEGETTSILRDKTSFPDVVSIDKSVRSTKLRDFVLGRSLPDIMTTMLKHSKFTKNVRWNIPDPAPVPVFLPSSLPASIPVEEEKEIEKEKGKEKEMYQPKVLKAPKKVVKDHQPYTDERLQDILILSSRFSRPLITTPYSVTAPKSYPESSSFVYPHILTDEGAKASGRAPSTVSVKAEKQRSDHLPQGSGVVVNVAEFPLDIFLPSPAVPRKPHRQSVLEARVMEHESEEIASKPARTRSVKVSIGGQKMVKKESGVYVLRGEGFKTVTTTRYETITAMANLAVVNCQAYGRNALNLKGFFILNCPDLSPLAFQLIYLNLSFNDIRYFPTEVFCLKNLQVLKLRNNPIKTIPSEVQQLKYLRIFEMSFNLVSVLPPGLFSLSYLEELDVSYNEITVIPNQIQKLRSLERLNVDGNELGFFPCGILKLSLMKIQFENNFTHPCFWKEYSLNDPQRLTHIVSLFIVKHGLHKLYEKIPAKIQNLLKWTSRCEWCHGPKFGEGFHIIHSYDIFGAAQLPVMFYVCSSFCYRAFHKYSWNLHKLLAWD